MAGMLPTMAWMMGQTRRFRRPRTLAESGLETDHRDLPLPLRIRTALSGARHSWHSISGHLRRFPEHYFWREATQGVEQIVDEVRQQTGQEPIVVGMSKWSMPAP